MLNHRTLNQSDLVPVLLAGVSDTLQEDPNKEPQFIRSRQTCQYRIYLDSEDGIPTSNPLDMTLSSKVISEDGRIQTSPDILIDKTVRLSPESIIIDYQFINVTKSNNLFRFEYNLTNYQFELEPGLYLEPYDIVNPDTSVKIGLLDEILRKMNFAINGSIPNPALFILDDYPNIPNFYKIISTAGLKFKFIDCPALRYGEFLYGLQKTDVMQAELIFGPVLYVSSRYIDFSSAILKSYSKHQTTATNGAPNLLFRVPLSKDDYAGKRIEYVCPNLVFDNFNIGANLSVIDMKVTNEFNQIFDGAVNLTMRPHDTALSYIITLVGQI